ncbi:MAG: DUF1549 domain-containing protein [Planctomycetales bacterium]|nr:DUF1549 domain-containing protein [Planctomycetales bacterium]
MPLAPAVGTKRFVGKKRGAEKKRPLPLCVVAPVFWLLPLAMVICSSLNTAASGSDVPSLDADATRTLQRRQIVSQINDALARHWETEGVVPAPFAKDEEFLRRATLDLTGIVPRASRVRSYLDDQNADKRERLIAELVQSGRYATHLATVWTQRLLPPGADEMHPIEAAALQAWLRTRFAVNLRYDNLVSGLLLTTGGDDLGPGLFYRTHDLAPEKLAASSAKLFLGVELQCAQCHDHPFNAWSQRDFWGLAAFFARVSSPDAARMTSRFRLRDLPSGEAYLPDSQEAVPPKFPRGAQVADAELLSRREALAFWLTSRDNPFLSRAAANWAWQHLLGEPLVESVEPASSAPDTPQERILGVLAESFVRSDYDLRELLTVIALTDAYRLSVEHPNPQSVPVGSFARMPLKPLTPEQIYDSLQSVSPTLRGTEALDLLADAMPDGESSPRAAFLRGMRSPPGSSTEFRAGTLQALQLMNGRTMAEASASSDNALTAALDAPYFSDQQRLEAIYLSLLSRLPTQDEQQGVLAIISDAAEGETPPLPPDRQTASAAASSAPASSDADVPLSQRRRRIWSDVVWALVNSSEFSFTR